MNKRGLSGVIAVVLIILIVIVAISLVWLFVQPAIIDIIGGGDDSGELDRFSHCLDLDLSVQSCVYDDSFVEVTVRRGEGDGTLTDLGFRFFADSGNFLLNTKDSLSGDIPKEYASSVFVFDGFGRIPNSVNVAGVFDLGACGFGGPQIQCRQKEGSVCGNGDIELGEECDDGNNVNGDGCSSTCQLEEDLSSCFGQDLTVVPLSDFDLDSCTRTRAGLLEGINPLPSAGVRVVGQDWDNAALTGTSLGRNIVHWYQMYDQDDNLDFSGLDFIIEGYHDAGMQVILTLRANHPEKSEHWFDINGRNLFQDDSWPKDEQEWKDYLQGIVDRYYVNPAPEHAGTLAAVQIGNEWGHQFVVNGSHGRYQEGQEQEAILDLMNFSYLAIKEVAPDLPVLAFAISGTPGWALGDGKYDSGDEWIYDGIYYGHNSNMDNISVSYSEDINQDTITGIKRIIKEGNASYDYFDAHIYFQRPEESRYVANFVRDLWYQNGITGKGLISTEFANPIYNYSYDWHGYSLKASQAVAYHAGFDTIIWGNWYPSPGSPNLLQASLRSDEGYQFDQIGNYTEFQGITKDFNSVSRQNGLFDFDSNEFDLDRDVPVYPGLYACSDGLDNDNDGFVDNADSDCQDVGCNGGKQDLDSGCIDPAGFAENNWIFCYNSDSPFCQ